MPARSTKPKFRVDAARELIADVPPVRDELELKRLAVSRLGKQVIDVVDVDAGYADTDGAPKQVLTDVTRSLVRATAMAFGRERRR